MPQQQKPKRQRLSCAHDLDDDEHSLPAPQQTAQEKLWNFQPQAHQSPYTKPLALWRVKSVLDTSPINSRDLFDVQTMQIPGMPRFNVPPLSLQQMQPIAQSRIQPVAEPSMQKLIADKCSPQPSVQPLEFLACQALSELGMKRSTIASS
jgi:hypothetical protein